MINKATLFEILETNYRKYNRLEFIEEDPISIPHLFAKKEDIEISAFLTASIAWGQRKTILANAKKLMQLMDNAPNEFITGSSKTDLKKFEGFVHRTFNGIDCVHFVKALKKIYLHNGGIYNILKTSVKGSDENIFEGIVSLRKIFFSISHESRTQKHFADPSRNSSCKRLNMFLRWMIRKDRSGVDFGLWDISPSLLLCPLDVHSGRIARELGLLKRTQDDWKAVCELTNALKEFDPHDPVKYDFALFGYGVSEKKNANPAVQIF